MQKVKESSTSDARRRRAPRSKTSTTRISAKNQATLPVEVLRRAGLRAGDKVRVTAEGTGRIVLERATQALRRWAGCLTGVYPKGHLAELRREWR
jgi:bifunctional DNA-binding transcriptional regulator/antitoxin component of YhaV-PrlF toxin-antitoxin module